MWQWLVSNKEWVFSGIGVAVITFLIALFKRRSPTVNQTQSSGDRSTNIQSAGNISVNEQVRGKAHGRR